MASESDQHSVQTFVHETLEMIRQVRPFVRALVEQPDREDILPLVTGPCFHLFHSVKGTSIVLGLEHLATLAEAMEYLLDRVRSGILLLTPRHIALLAECCTFLEQGLPLVRAEQSDARLSGPAATLATAIRQAVAVETKPAQEERATAVLFPEMEEPFLWETENLLNAVEQECVLWDFIVVDLERVAGLCRLLHRLKQGFALYDFHDPERICLALAATLNRYVQGECFQTEYPERVFLRSIDAIRTAIAGFSLAGDLAIPDLDHHLAAIQGMMRQPLGELLVEAGLVDPAIVDQALEVQRASAEEQPRRLGEVLVAMGEVTPEQVEGVLRQQHTNRERSREAETLLRARKPTENGSWAGVPGAHAICIDGRRLTRMGVVLEHLMARQLPGDHLPLLAELQSLLQSCRRDALASLTSRLQRVVHDLAVQGNKRVHFTVEGIEMLEETGEATTLAETLLHLLRNSVEHGLESIEERTGAGKRKIGSLQLLALGQGDEIWISVEDDGRGFDFNQVDAQLLKRGMVAGGRLERLTNRERMQLLLREPMAAPDSGQGAENLLPGLSAVHRTLQDMHGKINVTTRAGKGTCVTLRLPRRR